MKVNTSYIKKIILIITILFGIPLFAQHPSLNKINEGLANAFNEINSDSIYASLGLKNGDKVKVMAMFTINEEGKATNIKAKGPYPIFEQEAIKIIENLPQIPLKNENGISKSMNFALPITFVIEYSKKKKKK